MKAGKINAPRCKNDGCDNIVHCKGLCRVCYHKEFSQAKRNRKTAKEKKMLIDALEQELRSKETYYKCLTMVVPLKRRVDTRRDIASIKKEIHELEGVA